MSTERDGDDIIIFCTVENGCAARAIAAYSGRKRTKELFLIGQTPCGVHCIIFSTRKVQKKYTKNSHFYYSSFDSINTRARSGAHAKTLFKHARGEKNKTSPKHLIRQMEKSEQFSWFVYRKKIVRLFFFLLLITVLTARNDAWLLSLDKTLAVVTFTDNHESITSPVNFF